MLISMISTEASDRANLGIAFAHMRNCYKIQCVRLSYGRIVDGRSFKFLEKDPDRFCSAEEGFMRCCGRFQRATG